MRYGAVNINPAYRQYVLDHIKIFFDKYEKVYGDKEPIFVCVGTPRAPGDAIGPYVGTELKRLGYNVYGTEEDPVHAENIKALRRRLWAKVFLNVPVIAIDASISKCPIGYVDCNLGIGLAAGKGVGKDLGIIGNSCIKITTSKDAEGLYTITNEYVMGLAECVIGAIHSELTDRHIGNNYNRRNIV